jgi:hypothetical protein
VRTVGDVEGVCWPGGGMLSEGMVMWARCTRSIGFDMRHLGVVGLTWGSDSSVGRATRSCRNAARDMLHIGLVHAGHSQASIMPPLSLRMIASARPSPHVRWDAVRDSHTRCSVRARERGRGAR